STAREASPFSVAANQSVKSLISGQAGIAFRIVRWTAQLAVIMLTASATPARYFRGRHGLIHRRPGTWPGEHGPSFSAFAHVGGFAAEQEVVAWRSEEIDHLGVFAEPCLVLGASRNDHDVAGAADPLFAAEAELHLALEHPHDLLICVTVRLDIDARPDAPPDDHPLVAGENTAADLCADSLLGEAANAPKPTSVGITSAVNGTPNGQQRVTPTDVLSPVFSDGTT